MNKSRSILCLIMYVIIFLAGVTLWYFFLNPFIKSYFENEKFIFEILWMLGKTLIWVFPVFIYLTYVDSVKFLEYLKLKGNVKNGVKWGLLLGVTFIVLKLIQYHVMGKNINFHMDVYYWIGGILVGFFEEIPFRGFLQQKIESFTNFWAANVISTLIFLIHHFPKWIYIKNEMLLVDSIFVVFMGLIFGFVFKKTKSLWSVIIFHSLADLILFMGL